MSKALIQYICLECGHTWYELAKDNWAYDPEYCPGCSSTGNFKKSFGIDPLIDYTRRYDPNSQIAVVWSIDDVHTVRKDLSPEQAMDVLKLVESDHDANVGVNWDVLQNAANELFPIDAKPKGTNYTLYINGIPACDGQQVIMSDGEIGRFTGGRPPHKPSSQGFVWVKFDAADQACEYYASVIGGKWVPDEVNKCNGCGEEFIDELTEWDEYGEPLCPYCGRHGILAHQEPSKK